MSNTLHRRPEPKPVFTDHIDVRGPKNEHIATINMTSGYVTFTAVAEGFKLLISDTDSNTETHEGHGPEF